VCEDLPSVLKMSSKPDTLENQFMVFGFKMFQTFALICCGLIQNSLQIMLFFPQNITAFFSILHIISVSLVHIYHSGRSGSLFFELQNKRLY
jgi:hypothetical protein